MMLNMLVVTDHTTHTASNSVYRLCRAIQDDPRCGKVWVCSRGLSLNKDFFNGISQADIYGSEVSEVFDFDAEGYFFQNSILKISTNEIDTILIRIPQPPDPAFLHSLEAIVPPAKIVNSPFGVLETTTKAFLLTLPHLCPEAVLCSSAEEAFDMSRTNEIVLKPFYSYGGRGIMRLSREYGWNANDRYPLNEFSTILSNSHFPMIALKFLKNVTQGDKRTIVANKHILGSALRLPAPDSWMCNVAQGGHAILSAPDEDELNIEKELTPLLYDKGVVFYGFDTLVNDDGRRVLSEINTLSIGGLVPLEEMSGKPVVKEVAKLLWDYIEGTGATS